MSELIELEAAEARISSLLKPNPTVEHAEASFNLGVGYALAAIRSLPTVTRTEAEAGDSGLHRTQYGECGHHPCHQYDLREVSGYPGAAHGCVTCERDAAIASTQKVEASK